MSTRHPFPTLIFRCVVACVGVLIMPPLVAQPRAVPRPGEYRVVDGRVDQSTFSGWRVFHTACYGCHGVGAVGTDLAPNLVERIKTLTPREFTTKVLTSYRIVLPASEAGSDNLTAAREAMIDEVMRRERGHIVMPAWKTDAKVKPHVLDVYAYLSARADGKLGSDRPKLMSEKKRRS